MIRSFRIGLLAALTVIVGTTAAGAADTPLAGTWKFKLVNGGGDNSIALVKIENKDGKPAASFESILGLPPSAKLEGLRIDGNSLHFTFSVGATAVANLSAPKGEDKPKTLRGTIEIGHNLLFTELERTDLKELTPAEARKQTPGGEAMNKLGRTPLGEREAALKEILEKYGDTTAGYTAGEMLLGIQAKAGAKDDDLRATADAMLKVAKNYGPAAERHALISAAQQLARAEKVSPLAVDIAQGGEDTHQGRLRRHLGLHPQDASDGPEKDRQGRQGQDCQSDDRQARRAAG